MSLIGSCWTCLLLFLIIDPVASIISGTINPTIASQNELEKSLPPFDPVGGDPDSEFEKEFANKETPANRAALQKYLSLLDSKRDECKRSLSDSEEAKAIKRGYCEAEADVTFTCLPKTTIGETQSIPCTIKVEKFNNTFTGYINRTCGPRGQWLFNGQLTSCALLKFENILIENQIPSENQGLIWQKMFEYSFPHPKKEKAPGYYIYLVMPIISCSFCVLGLIVLSWLYPRNHVRNNIHRFLFASIFLWDLMDLVFLQIFNVYVTQQEPNVDKPLCHGIYFTAQFFYASTVMWLFNEGLHHFWIIFFPYKDPLKLRVFLVISFSVSCLLTFCYLVPATLNNGGHPVCVPQDHTTIGVEFLRKREMAFFYILSSIHTLDILIFIYLMVILRRKIQRENNSSAKKRWRLTRSWFILLILFGGGIFIEIAETNNPDLLYAQRIISGLESFFLFMSQVVFSKDVTNKLALKWRRHKQKNILPPLKTSKSPLKFFKRLTIKRTKRRKPPTIIYTVNPLRKPENIPEQNEDHVTNNESAGGIVNDGFTGPETQHTNLGSPTSLSSPGPETGEHFQIPRIDSIQEEPQVDEDQEPQKVESNEEIGERGVDNEGFEREDAPPPCSSAKLPEGGVETQTSKDDTLDGSFADSGIEIEQISPI